jgi:hypothetical protein
MACPVASAFSAQLHLRGDGLHDYFGSGAAATPGSRNLVGVADKAVDQLIERIVYARDRDEQVAATHALDRVCSGTIMWHRSGRSTRFTPRDGTGSQNRT